MVLKLPVVAELFDELARDWRWADFAVPEPERSVILQECRTKFREKY